MAESPVDRVFHFPPDVSAVAVDAVCALCRSKQDVIDFLRGAGVPHELLDMWQQRVIDDRRKVRKSEIARDVITALNALGDQHLRSRREVIKRIVEFDDFGACWPEDRLKAQGLVAAMQKLVNVKDSFTRMSIERENERAERQAQSVARRNAQEERSRILEAIEVDLRALFLQPDVAKRGKALEGVLNRLFAAYEILVKEAFVVRGSDGEGIVAQIDGLIELDSHIFLVEMKWWSGPLGKADVSPHLVNVMNRPEVRGILISHSDFTEPAVQVCREFLAHRVCVLCQLREFVLTLERRGDLRAMLRTKINAAMVEKKPWVDAFA